MKSNGLKKAGVIVLALLELQLPVFAAPARMHVLKGHVIQQIQNSVRMGRVPADEGVDLSLVVQVDQTLLDQTLADIYGRQATQPGHFLSSAEFAQKFSLSQKRRNLKNFAVANGLTVNAAEDRDDSMLVKVSGRADQVEQAFHIQFNRYRRANGQVFRAHETDPMVPEAIAADLSAVMGLSNLTGVARPHLRTGQRLTGSGATAAPSIRPRFAGSFGGAITPSDIKTIYGLNTPTQNGAGQTVAIFELDGYKASDIAGYETQFSLPTAPLTFVGVDGETNHCYWFADDTDRVITNGNAACDATALAHFDSGMVEVALDIEMVSALAPNIAHIYVYDSANSFLHIVAQYDQIATDNLASVVSTSWGSFELNGAFAASEAPIFARMAAQGQAVFAASGDSGAFDDPLAPSTLAVDDPASQIDVTGVGGTSLSGTVSAPVETAWDGSGGGVSVGLIPSYQSGVPGLASQTNRNVPDVALNADPASGYAVYVGGSIYPFLIGGTSAAAPLWTALMASVNQSRATLGRGVLGFANPSLYQVGISTSYSTSFHDITSGNNGAFTAHAGYDNITGLGSYHASELIAQISSVPGHVPPLDLSNVYAYPNPWDIRKDTGFPLTFKNVPAGATVKIFTVSGFLVRTLTAGGNNQASWDLTNDSGRTVASGLYIYMVLNGGEKIISKIAVIK